MIKVGIPTYLFLVKMVNGILAVQVTYKNASKNIRVGVSPQQSIDYQSELSITKCVLLKKILVLERFI